jgi:phosphoserine phosphatase RsbU/P
MLASVKDLVGGAELGYRWEDVPPHVRRIAERERQRVELETARRIQSSILPELPPQLHGVEISHAYLPASEVGGDFYDVLALEDGRLALAVGDVAGHGVSSGLVMSMAKSALAVQVTFDPDVNHVFRTLNRTVFQTARKRLLATLCYAVLDPVRRELLYASAGHLFPYRIDRRGRVDALESIAYPLGVRDDLEVLSQKAQLEPGDTLFLFSDGIVEARRQGTDEMFGFDRLEQVLHDAAEETVAGMRDAVLAAVEDFTGPGPQDDDRTVLVLRLP